MFKHLPLNLLDPYVTTLKKRCAFLYGIDEEEIEDRYKQLRGLVVSNKVDRSTPMLYRRSLRKIVINKDYIYKDKDGNYISFTDDNFFKHTMIHELLHAVSHNDRTVGFCDYDSDVSCTGLNEGVTQVFADDILGYVENKYLGSYNELKIISKIIRNTVGNELLFDSYFNDPNILKNELNKISGDKDFYNSLNEKMTSFNTLFVETFIDKSSTTAKMLYYKKFESLLKYVVLNLVAPKCRTMNDEERKKYIQRLVYDTAADDQAKNTLMNIISEYLNVGEDKVKEEKKKQESESKELDDHIDFVYVVDNGQNVEDIIYTRENGDVFILASRTNIRQITSTQELKYVYNKLFEAKGYPSQFDKRLVKKYINHIKSSKPLSIKQDSILKKRIIYCGIVNRLNKEGLYLLNDFREFDNSDTIKPEYINTNYLSFKDLEKIANRFYIGKEGNFSYSLFDRHTRSKIDNPALKVMGFFANNWLDAAGEKETKGESVIGITDAFSKEKKRMYENIRDAIDDVTFVDSNFDIEKMEKRLSEKEKKIFRKMFDNPTRFEWSYEFLRSEAENVMDDEYKGKSFFELENEDYMNMQSHDDMLNIVSNK